MKEYIPQTPAKCKDCKELKLDLNHNQCRACSLKEIKKWMKKAQESQTN